MEPIQNHLDDAGRVAVWPSKRKLKQVVLEYLVQHFEFSREYTEKEVNARLNQLHTFEDPALLRRELFENGLLGRTKNGATYWRTELTE
jgi:hypothetical protein